MTVIQFPKHMHSTDGNEKCLHCEIFRLIKREFPDITAIEAGQKLVEALADLIKIGAKPEDYEGALRDVTTDLEHVLLQKITFGPVAPPA